MNDLFQSPLILLIISGIIAAIASYIRTINNKVSSMITEPRVRELIEDKLEAIHVNNESTNRRLTRLEEGMLRIEEKIDLLLSAK